MKIIVIPLLLLASPALAIDYTFDQTVKVMMPDHKTPVKICHTEEEMKANACADETIGDVIQKTLVNPVTTTGQVGDADSGKAGLLAFRLYGIDHPTLKAGEPEFIMHRGDKLLGPIENGRLREILDPQKEDK